LFNVDGHVAHPVLMSKIKYCPNAMKFGQNNVLGLLYNFKCEVGVYLNAKPLPEFTLFLF
jgi:hypothetical protein